MRPPIVLFAILVATSLLVGSRPSTSVAPIPGALEQSVAFTLARPLTSFGPTQAGLRQYPSDPAELGRTVRAFLADAAPSSERFGDGRRLVGLIAPHAGYEYSGAVAGYAYEAASRSADVRTVVVLGPRHRDAPTYASTVDREVYRTPVGDVPIATDLVADLLVASGGLLQIDAEVLSLEHSVDVQMPFIAVAFPSARVVPILLPPLGRDGIGALAALLFRWVSSDPTAIVVASSDMSHYFDYATAQRIDREIVQEIEDGDVGALLGHRANRRGPCGVTGIAVMLEYLKMFGPGGRVQPLRQRNGGDTPAGDKARVVGYLAAAITVPAWRSTSPASIEVP